MAPGHLPSTQIAPASCQTDTVERSPQCCLVVVGNRHKNVESLSIVVKLTRGSSNTTFVGTYTGHWHLGLICSINILLEIYMATEFLLCNEHKEVAMVAS